MEDGDIESIMADMKEVMSAIRRYNGCLINVLTR